MASLHGIHPPLGAPIQGREDEEPRGVPRTSPLVRGAIVIAICVAIAAFVAWAFLYIMEVRSG